MQTDFTPISGLLGGALIGLAAVLLLLANGRIAGISGIVGGLLTRAAADMGWRVAFVLGLWLGALVYWLVRGELFAENLFRDVVEQPFAVHRSRHCMVHPRALV